ncbi:MAG: enoyl-CoA hydratase-related protein [SAR324 cluster bacterium]|nr:enoyl-CoA hydratase-related protein [SAR324 cluster bacterium]
MLKAANVDVRMDNGVATLTISDEKRMNLMNTPTMERLLAAGEALRADPDLRLVVLTGGGNKAFIGGADINELAGLDAYKGRAFITLVHQVCHLFRSLPVPSIARINGFCLGAGMEVAASCDLRIGALESRYGMPEVQLGLPSVVEAVMLPTLIGWGRTREILYTGDVFDAQWAGQIGFLERTAPLAELDEAMRPWIESILAAEPGAVRIQKRLIESWLDTGVAAGVQESIDAFSQALRSPAPGERLQAFLDRPRGN